MEDAQLEITCPICGKDFCVVCHPGETGEQFVNCPRCGHPCDLKEAAEAEKL